MTNDPSLKANQEFLSWCGKFGHAIERVTIRKVKEYFAQDRSLSAEDKFWVGYREHGAGFTDLTDKQLDKMIEEELHDLRHYVGLKVKRHYEKKITISKYE